MKSPKVLNEFYNEITVTNFSKRQDSLYSTKLTNGDRDMPTPIDEKVIFSLEQQKELDSKYYHYRVSAQVNEIIRGQEALTLMGTLGGNMEKLHLVLDEGYEYLMANISISVLSSEGNNSLLIHPYYFNLRNSEGEAYETSISLYEHLFNAEIDEGRTASGWFSFVVSEKDTDPLLESVDVWFRTN